MSLPKSVEQMFVASQNPALMASDPENTMMLVLTQRDAALVNLGAHLTRCLYPDYVDDVHDLLAKLIGAGHVRGFLPGMTDDELRDLGIDLPSGEGDDPDEEAP